MINRLVFNVTFNINVLIRAVPFLLLEKVRVTSDTVIELLKSFGHRR